MAASKTMVFRGCLSLEGEFAMLKNTVVSCSRDNRRSLIARDFKSNKLLYLMVVPMVVYLLIFCYYPMYGAVIAFKTFVPARGILGSPWVGMKHFTDFFGSFYFWRLLKNTFLISFWSLVFGFPAPILLALMFNEVRGKLFKKVSQTIRDRKSDV
jgi:putative aldouronate transport system permease protein